MTRLIHGTVVAGFENVAEQFATAVAAEPDPGAFGHSGAVGAQSFADPTTGIAYSYTRRRFSFGRGGGAPENHRLIRATLQAAADI
ncbi:hypothetical protein [Streptosporangium sp. NPDC000396]|uniref:hypothetical protein n=1 Tax=Streptosporangium sp. NPDC000396 TaxID=3366185 RepID=UPI003697F33E